MNRPPESRITLELPAMSASLRYARVVAATMADDAGFDVARIEMLRLAVDELCAVVIDVAADGVVLALEFWIDGGAVAMRGTCGPVTDDPLIDPIAEQVLKSVRADHDVVVEDGTCTVTMRCSA